MHALFPCECPFLIPLVSLRACGMSVINALSWFYSSSLKRYSPNTFVFPMFILIKVLHIDQTFNISKQTPVSNIKLFELLSHLKVLLSHLIQYCSLILLIYPEE